MEKSQIILRLLVPADQETAKRVHPRMRPLHNPHAALAAIGGIGAGFFSCIGYLAHPFLKMRREQRF